MARICFIDDDPMIDRVKAQEVNTILVKARITMEEIEEAVQNELRRAKKISVSN
jgi:hypothetical protein